MDGTVDPKVLITERSHPDYIRRDAVETVKIDIDLKAQIEELALEKTILRDRSYSWRLLTIVHYCYLSTVPELRLRNNCEYRWSCVTTKSYLG